MDATTTHSMRSLVSKLQAAHPTLTFTEDEHFLWSPDTATISYNTSTPNGPALLLHEVAHALLSHRSYHRDIELVAMEAAAWETAIDYSARASLEEYVSISDEVVQDHLDTYREWLDARSTCPSCKATGFQTEARQYSCPACSQVWKVNEARLCALRRYSVNT